MSVTILKPPDLLKCSDGEFNTGIQNLGLKELLETISLIQKEQKKEQENFDLLKGELASLSKSSSQYKQIQREMKASQNRMTALMNRSMSCFKQQGHQHVSKPVENEEKRNSGEVKNPGKPHTTEINTVQNSKPASENGVIKAGIQAKENKPDQTPATKPAASVNKIQNSQQNGSVRNGEEKAVRTSKVTVTFPVKPDVKSASVNSQSDQKPMANGVSKSTVKVESAPNTKPELSQSSKSSVKVSSVENSSVKAENSSTNNSNTTKPVSGVVKADPKLKSSTAPPVVYHMGRPVAVDQNLGQNRDQMLDQIRNFKRKSDTVPEVVKPEAKEVFSSTASNVSESSNVKRSKDHQSTSEEEGDSGAGSVESSPKVEKFVSSFSFPQKSHNTSTKMEKQTEQSVQKGKTTPAAPSKTDSVKESEEKEAEVRQTLDGKEDAASKQKLLSEEEQAGVPVETEEEEDEVAPVRVNLSSWDPTKLLKDLYAVQLMPDDAKDISDKFVAMEGLMEKLPMNKKKATLLKTWKRRFFRAKDGWLYYYETSSRDKPSDTLQLMGGKVDDLGNRILGIDDGRGKYLMVRCPTDKEYGQWKLALESQTADNVKATYVRPVLSCPQHPQKKVILIDIGSSAIRAGILGEHATLPTLFFPNVVAHSGDSKELAVGIEAFRPEYRKMTSKTVHPTDKVDKFSIDMSTIGAVFKKVFTDLKVEPSEYWLMISTPQNLGDKIRAGLMETLIDKYGVQGVCMVMQSLLALYSYNATSGIIVDVGERMEILPIYDGFVIEGGVSRQSYGGQKVIESLNSCLQGYNFSTPIQQLLVRYVMEQSCYLVNDYKETLKKCEEDPDSYKATVYLNNFDLPEGATMEVTHDYSCFKSPEGFFNTDLWGMDYPCVHKLVFQAIQSCPIDSRKRMYRAIFLSGGVTRLPGFAERLQCELQKLAPPSVMVEVHASPQRYHSAYIGACSLANMEQFKQICISAEEWKKDGVKTFKKWNMAG